MTQQALADLKAQYLENKYVVDGKWNEFLQNMITRAVKTDSVRLAREGLSSTTRQANLKSFPTPLELSEFEAAMSKKYGAKITFSLSGTTGVQYAECYGTCRIEF